MSGARKWTVEDYHAASVAAIRSHYLFRDCADYVGYPPDSVLQCGGQHGVRAHCTICGWNYCGNCLGLGQLMCLMCNDFPCKGCKPLSSSDFRAWNGRCAPCAAKGYRTIAQQREAPGVEEDDVIIVEEEMPDAPVGCPGVHTATEVCAVCKWNCCRECAKPKREGTR